MRAWAMATRRQFLRRSAAAVAAATVYAPSARGAGFDPSSWASVRDQFLLDDGVTNLTTFLLASHPKGVKSFMSEYAAGGYSYKHTFKTPGTYKFICDLHEGMKMTVKVRSR